MHFFNDVTDCGSSIPLSYQLTIYRFNIYMTELTSYTVLALRIHIIYDCHNHRLFEVIILGGGGGEGGLVNWDQV